MLTNFFSSLFYPLPHQQRVGKNKPEKNSSTLQEGILKKITGVKQNTPTMQGKVHLP
jgi:hypothetical protein